MAKLNENDLRAMIARKVGVHEFPDLVWARVREEAGYVWEDALAGYETAIEDLATDVEEALATWRVEKESLTGRATPPGRKAGARIEVHLNDDERRRRDTLSAYLADCAADDPRVIAFRNHWLSGRMLDGDEVRALFLAREHPDPDQAEEGVRPVYISVPGREGYVPAWPGSPLYALWGVSRALVEDYGWPEEGASWFVLTGQAPQWSPASVETSITRRATPNAENPRDPVPTFVDQRITLTFAPWVSADTVRDAYRAAQRDMLGGDNRPITEKMTTLFTFVNQRRPAMSWGEIAAAWGEACEPTHPEWKYKGEGSQPRRNIQKDYERVARLLLAPRFPRKPRSSVKTLRIREVLPGRSTDIPGGEVKNIPAKDWPKYATDERREWVIVESIPAP